MQLHYLFVNAECYVEKYFCNQDTVTAVCLKKQKHNLRILTYPNNTALISPALMKTEGSKCSSKSVSAKKT